MDGDRLDELARALASWLDAAAGDTAALEEARHWLQAASGRRVSQDGTARAGGYSAPPREA